MEHACNQNLSRKVAFLFISMCILFGLLVLANQVNPAIEIPDRGLRGAVREKINRESGPIYRSDVALITELDASNRGISSLEGLQYFKKLVVLNLENNRVEDLSPLSGLSILRDLNLRNNHISDLYTVHFEEIGRLPLQRLDLSRNSFTDGDVSENLSLLLSLEQLERLHLGQNRIHDFSALSSLKKLRVLDLRDNNINDISLLNQFTTLKEINLRGNMITDMSTLAPSSELTYLNIHSNPIEQGVEAVGRLVNLETLIMRNVEIGDNSGFLRELTHLQNLNIRNTSITDLTVLVDLMESGTLQDQPENGVKASVNLLELALNSEEDDPYLDLKPYWENITYRFPLSLPYYPGPIKPPVFSRPAGFYQEGFHLELAVEDIGGRIYYTLDGSEPSLWQLGRPEATTMLYTVPIWVENRTSQPNRLSTILTSKAEPSYFPEEPVFKGTVIRAIVVDTQDRSSNVVTSSYFIEEGILERYTFPVVSLVTDEKGLFDPEIGIYVPGGDNSTYDTGNPGNIDANYNQRGMKWERPVHFEYFSQFGQQLFSINAGVRIHGGATREAPQKSLRLYTSNGYDELTSIEYNFFPELNSRSQTQSFDSFVTLIFRNGGNEWSNSLFTDELAHSLLVPTRLDIQGSQPIILFINGEYWGIHSIRNRYDEHYFASYYGIDLEDLTVLEMNALVKIGDETDRDIYIDMLQIIDLYYSENNYRTVDTLNDDSTYQRIANRMDIGNFIDYYVAQVYFDNKDWPGNNVITWRFKNENSNDVGDHHYGYDGKWRWIILDADLSFRYPSHNSLYESTHPDSVEWNNPPWSTYLIRSLLQNDSFRHQFINRFADSLNTIFREEVVLNKVDELAGLYQPEINEHVLRWGNGRHQPSSLQNWNSTVQEIQEFALLRPGYQRQHIIEYFNLPGSFVLSTEIDSNHGHFRINSIEIEQGMVGVNDPSLWTGTYFIGVPIEISAISKIGYRFVRWEGLDSQSVDIYSPTITLVANQDIVLTAIFHED